jgi:Ca2+-transporting ATPase
MEGPEFREMYEKDPKGLISMLPHLQVLARSSPEDKYILVSELKKCGEVVAVTGDGTNDAPALKKAHVGLAMGSGTEVAKEAADIIVMDDNFTTIVTACKWGRSIYENVRKFLQFQLTVNVVALMLLVIAAITQYVIPSDGKVSLPLTAIQLLWLNMIMDTMAALALSTEEPDDNLLDRQPYGKYESLITPHMWVAILGQGLYQLIILFTLYLAGVKMGISSASYHYTATETNNTFVFNVFVWCQLWNMFNCRKTFPGEWNIFTGMTKSFIFFGVLVFCVVIQVVFIELGAIPIVFKVLQTTGLNWIQWFVSIGISFLCVPYHFVVIRPLQLLLRPVLGRIEQALERKPDYEPVDTDESHEENSEGI